MSHSGLFWGPGPRVRQQARLSLLWLLLELQGLRSGTRHTVAKQPEAGDLEGTTNTRRRGLTVREQGAPFSRVPLPPPQGRRASPWPQKSRNERGGVWSFAGACVTCIRPSKRTGGGRARG